MSIGTYSKKKGSNFLELVNGTESAQPLENEKTSTEFLRLLGKNIIGKVVKRSKELRERKCARKNWKVGLKVFDRGGKFLAHGSTLDVSLRGIGILIDNAQIRDKSLLDVVIPLEGGECFEAICQVTEARDKGDKQILGLRILELTPLGHRFLEQALAS